MTLKQRWLRCLPAGLILAALVLTVAWVMRPQSFTELIPMEQAVEFSVHTTGSREQHVIRESFLDLEEIEPLLDLLQDGTLRFRGRSRGLAGDPEETMYRLYSYRKDGLPEDFYLCTDGMVHIWHERIGFVHYRLSGCDMEAVVVQLEQMLGM